MRIYTVKENHVGSAVSKILDYRKKDLNEIFSAGENKESCAEYNPWKTFFFLTDKLLLNSCA